MKFCKHVIAVFLFIACMVPALHAAASAEPELPRFHEVVPGKIFRGGQPSEAGFGLLPLFHVRTVVDLRSGGDAVEQEREWAERLGIRFVSAPMSGWKKPSERSVNLAESVLNDPENYPVYVHCRKGEDRTGLVIALYRVFSQGWPPAQAYREMRELGFHNLLHPLKEYFEQKTGYDP